MNEISTKLYRINFRYLLDNVLVKALWKKSWVVYDYDNFKVHIRLYQISIHDNEVELRVHHENSFTYNDKIIGIPMSAEHFNEKVFFQKLFNAIEDIIKTDEHNAIRKTEAYDRAADLDTVADTKNEEFAKARLDDLSITAEDVREAYVDKYVSDHSTSHVVDVLVNLKYMLRAPRYMMLAYQLEKDCPEYTQRLLANVSNKFADTTVEEYTEKILKALTLIELEEMPDLQEALKSIKKVEEEKA